MKAELQGHLYFDRTRLYVVKNCSNIEEYGEFASPNTSSTIGLYGYGMAAWASSQVWLDMGVHGARGTLLAK